MNRAVKAGRASRTATMVCMGRAAAHGRTVAPLFSDPTALALLAEEDRRDVERAISQPHGLRDRAKRAYFDLMETMMVTRTIAMDQTIRKHVPVDQLVILGAGLDGRAWRMPELANTTVFEVDHPDTQAQKRPRAAKLTQQAKEIRFVPVDFTRDSLDEQLQAAGHDPTLRTGWIWEGVIPYLALSQIEATLEVLAKRSARGSWLTATYQRFAVTSVALGWYVGREGEPFLTLFREGELDALLKRKRFTVKTDDELIALARGVGLNPSRFGVLTRSSHIVTAEVE
jgi:methyltransferase (TIGR00027 family)